MNITKDLSWTNNTTSLEKKKQLHFYLLHKFKRAGAWTPIKYSFYRGAIESILGSCTTSNHKALQCVVSEAERIIVALFPILVDIYNSHPSNCFFTLLPSGRRFCSLRVSSTRLNDSFFPPGCQGAEFSPLWRQWTVTHAALSNFSVTFALIYWFHFAFFC